MGKNQEKVSGVGHKAELFEMTRARELEELQETKGPRGQGSAWSPRTKAEAIHGSNAGSMQLEEGEPDTSAVNFFISRSREVLCCEGPRG